MPVISRINQEGYQARVHAHCGRCLRPWCACHRAATRYFADAKYGGRFMSLQLARQWCRDAWKANVRAVGKKVAGKQGKKRLASTDD